MATLKRNYLFDNIKYLLVLSVIIVHYFSPFRKTTDPTIVGLTNNDFCNTLCTVIHLYIMSGFFIISGFFSSSQLSYERFSKLISSILLPYLFFEIISSLISAKDTTELFIEPFYHLWFIAFLFFYKLLTPYLPYVKLKAIYMFIFIMTIGAHFELPGFSWAGWDVVKYAPYYLIGYWLGLSHKLIADFNASLIIKLLSILGIGLSIYGLYFYNVNFIEVIADNDDTGGLTSIPYIIQTYSTFESITRDIIYRILSIILPLCVFILVPRRKSYISRMGKNSLYVYLLHPILIPILEKSGLYDNSGVGYLLILFFVSVSISFLLSLDIIPRIFSILFNFISKGIIKDPLNKNI